MFIDILLLLLAALAVAVLVVLGLAMRRPKTFTITRTAAMTAPIARVFAQINNFYNWGNWSPWAKKDPAAKGRFEGEAAGTGAIFHWDGNNQVGAGSMRIVESRAPDYIHYEIHFLRPMVAINQGYFTLREDGSETHVTWSMSGELNLLSRIAWLFMDMDKMIGDDFEKGLAGIKTIAESGEGVG